MPWGHIPREDIEQDLTVVVCVSRRTPSPFRPSIREEA